ncbi:MAG: hypothetical protein RBS13_02180 [Bacteroidales bacterium]|jgi:hypothetical protein|nr:hypothetical protein [Bacteroidales bacterium]
MKNLMVLVLSFLFINVNYAQLEAEWFTAYGDNNTDLARAIAIDKQGNTYTIGYISKDLGDFKNPKVHTFAFLLKHDVKGKLLWGKEIYGDSGNEGKAIALDSDDNIYIAGIFLKTIRLDGKNMISESEDANAYLAKYDNNGNYIWHKVLRPHQDGKSDPHQHDEHVEKHEEAEENGNHQHHNHFHPIVHQITNMKIDTENNIYLIGYFSKEIDFDPSEKEVIVKATDPMDVYVLKLDKEGNYQWVRTLSGKGANKGNSLAIDSKNNIYFTGSFEDKASLGKLSVQADGGSGMYIAKINNKGEEQWIKQITNTKINTGNHIHINKNDNIYVTGYIGSRTDFPEIDTLLTDVQENMPNVFIAVLNTDGKYQWVKSIKGNPSSSGECILTDEFDNIYVSGFFTGNIESQETKVESSGKEDGFIMMLNKEGDIYYTYPIGGISYDRSSKMVIHTDNSLVLLGAHNGPFFIDPLTFTNYIDFTGVTDAHIIKFSHTLEKPNLKLSNIQPQSIQVDWDVQPYAIGYEIIVEQGKYSSPYYVGNNSIILSTLLPGTAYTIKGRAYNDSKHSKQSSVKIITPPLALDGKSVKSDQFTARWTKSKTEKFTLYVSMYEDFSVCLPDYNGVKVKNPSLKIINLKANTNYYYRLQTEMDNFSNTVKVTTKE